MSLEFLTTAAALVASSPFEHDASDAGAHFEARDGWNVAVSYGDAEAEARARRETVAWADVSHLGKIEVQGEGVGVDFGRATRSDGAWLLPLTPSRLLMTCPPGQLRDRLAALEGSLDVTSVFGAVTIAGPHAREVFARFCAIDLRPQAMPVAALRPASVARQPGIVVREGEDRFLWLFGAGVAHYVWSVVDDAARPYGGRPVGVDALEALDA
jgi:heterotetrameric sarcosine oxidase gamma subunit